MALSEARAAWQRTVNRCFVQEDAKRAPKLACCPAAPSSIKPADTGSIGASGGQTVPITTYVSSNLNVSYSNLSPISKWWLYAQPNCDYLKDSTNEPGIIQMDEKRDFGDVPFSPYNCQDPPKVVPYNCQDPPKVEDMGDPKVEADSKSSWTEVGKNAPWWRTADMDELASFVAESSLDHLENCDLPRPQNAHLKKDVDCKSGSANDGIRGSLINPKLCQKLEGHSMPGADETLRMLEMDRFGDDASKAQLMEALRHSQTRARVAEKAANQACAEKERVVELVFRQASQLFAYKQWLRLLQLETMYLKSVPWTHQKTRNTQRNSDTSSSRKRACPLYDAGKCAVVFALGLGLVGAGFLLGWTIAWMAGCYQPGEPILS